MANSTQLGTRLPTQPDTWVVVKARDSFFTAWFIASFTVTLLTTKLCALFMLAAPGTWFLWKKTNWLSKQLIISQ